MDIVLFQPEIPPNTGNSIRLCANVGATLHLIEPIGFSLDDKHLKRAGLDYHDLMHMKTHATWADFVSTLKPDQRCFVFTTSGKKRYDQIQWQADDVLLFGRETAGLPTDIIASFDENHRVYLPMRQGCRSVNLSNTVAIACYEIWRQHNFDLDM